MNSESIDSLKTAAIEKKEISPKKLSELYNNNPDWSTVIYKIIEIHPEYKSTDIVIFATNEYIENHSASLSNVDKKFIMNIHSRMLESDEFIQSTKLIQKGTKSNAGSKRLCLLKCGGCGNNYIIFYDRAHYTGNCYSCSQKDKANKRAKYIKKYTNILSTYNYSIYKNRQLYTKESTIEICCPKNHKIEIIAKKIKHITDGIQCIDCNIIYPKISPKIPPKINDSNNDKDKTQEELIKEITGKNHNIEKIKKLIEDNNCKIETVRKTTVIYWCPENAHILTCEPRTKIINNNIVHCDSCRLQLNPKSMSQQVSQESIQTILSNNDFELQSQYVNNSTVLKLYCQICKTHIYMAYLNWGKQMECTNCKMKNKAETTSVQQKKVLGQIFSDEVKKFNYKLREDTDKYQNNTTKFLIECDKAHVYTTCQDNFVNRKRRCPSCKQSTGEEYIEKYLNDKNIIYKKEFIFPDGACKNIYNLRFDFYVEYNNKKFMIEFDGEQHFKPIQYFGGDESYQKLFNNDCKKTYYCVNTANIPLLRVAFNDFDKLEKLLDKFLTIDNIGLMFSNSDYYKKLKQGLEKFGNINILK
jgi:ribosomal protein S27E